MTCFGALNLYLHNYLYTRIFIIILFSVKYLLNVITKVRVFIGFILKPIVKCNEH